MSAEKAKMQHPFRKTFYLKRFIVLLHGGTTGYSDRGSSSSSGKQSCKLPIGFLYLC